MTVATMREMMARSHAAQYHAHCPWPALNVDDGLVITRGEGIYVFDADARRYIDSASGGWNVTLGFSARPLIDAAVSQLNALPYYHTLYNRTTEPALALSEALRALVPFEAGRVVYSNSGSEAVEVAVKLAWLYHAERGEPRRRKLLSRAGSVHGSTILTACLGGLGLDAVFGPDIRLVRHVSSPNHALYAEPDETEEAFVQRLLDELRAAIADEGADAIAAMIIEPIPVVEGFHAPPPAYLEGVKAILDEHGILLIFDEVITGCGRTGEMFASDWIGCTPDIVVLGKGLTSGYAALAATLPARRVGDRVDRHCAAIGEFPHATTTAMHPVAMRVALATLGELTGGVLDHARAVAPHFHHRLHALAALPGIDRIDGVGLGGSIHLHGTGDVDRAFAIAADCRARGLLLHGQHGSIILAPPLIIAPDEIDRMFDILASGLRQIA